ncbi:uncharacterized protein METZ01_LOCUS285339, partial [marine metagenome]
MFRQIRPDTWSHLATAAALIVGVLILGTAGYTVLGLSLIDAAYQTVITVSTVGFREVANGDPNTAWKAYTSVLILTGAGSMLYGATSVIESIVEGRLSGQFWRFRMQRTIDDLSGHLVVCGTGRVGRTIEQFVRSVGHEVVVVDRDETRLPDDVLHVVGDATSDKVLRAAGIDRAATLVSALGTSVDNLYVTLSSRKMNPGLFIVSRADDSEAMTKMLQVGADRALNPYEIAGSRMASLATQPNVADFVDVVVHDGDFGAKLREIRLTEGCDFVGRTIDDLAIRQETG